MPKHAPPPFKITHEGRGRLLIKASHSDGKLYAIAQIMAGAFGTETASATALLFEASPELLEACRLAEKVIASFRPLPDEGSEVQTALHTLRVVLAKVPSQED